MENTYKNEGTYGCILDNIPCGKKDTDPLLVSKVYLEYASAKAEWRSARRISMIDPTQKFFIYPKQICKTDSLEVAKLDQKKECRLLRNTYSKKQTLAQTVMAKANESLHDYLVKLEAPIDRFAVLKILENCFQAVNLLIQNGLVHQDIRAKNILMIGGEARLADFGLLVTEHDFYDVTKNIMWNQERHYIPPEMIYAIDSQYFDNEIKVFGVIIDHRAMMYKAIGYKASNYWLLDIEERDRSVKPLKDLLADLATASKSSTPGKNLSKLTVAMMKTKSIMNVNQQHSFHLKYDVFSLGMLVLECEKYAVPRDKDDPKILELYKKLITGCCSITPDSRYTIEEALSVFTEVSKLGSSSGGKKPKRRSSRRP
jgi:serine/threonine protein kinase